MRSWFDVRYLLPGLAVAFGLLGWYHLQSSGRDLSIGDPAGLPPRSPGGRALAVAGLVEARSENLAIGTALAGLVLDVHVPAERVGDEVAAGTALFRVDDRHLRAERKLALAEVEVAQAQLDRLERQPRAEELPPSAQRLRAAEELVKLRRDKAERARVLGASRAIGEEEVVERGQELHIALRDLERVKAEDALLRAGAWGPDVAIAKARLAQAQARVEQLGVEIDRAIVRAPVGGRVLRVDVRPGEYVTGQPGQALVLLGDVGTLHVRVDVDEQDVPRFRPGTRAWATVRGDAAHRLGLRFVRVEPYVAPKRSLTGDAAERIDTRVLRVVYALESPPANVYVGQQVDVFIE